ncbi:MAG: tRNA uridine-5-carboxymethylaminomethyl(34) synthesis GTPase MnmE [Treponema sp.]|nr:tRNA uridine-5-carboxymethylaminomethyl(34) synthesis GTPase MnmE [Treponema sp.]
MRNYGDDCAIAAQASQGAIALIRTSGNDSLELLAKVFSRPQSLLKAAGNSVVYGWIQDKNGSPIDEALVSVYRAPRSYTGEDGADISCHGGCTAVNTILETLRKAGFCDALPGEFTFRAFMNGKIDLTRSESVMEMVSATTKNALEHAIKRLSGILEREIKAIRDTLLEAVSAAELFLDYPEDEIDEGPPPYREAAEKALKKLKLLAASYNRERLYQEGAIIVIAGRPNAGKSSLFNALLKEDRSIVTEMPGTTRDWIEASVSIKGIPLRLMDTAGLRDVEIGHNEAEIQGIKRSKSLIQEADIILYTVDSCAGLCEDDKKFLAEYTDSSLMLIWNKIDRTESLSTPQSEESNHFVPCVSVSAVTGKGLNELCTSITDLLLQKISASDDLTIFETNDQAGLGTQRQKELTEKAVTYLEEAILLDEKDESLDLIAPLLRESLNALGEITGEVSTADILEIMFSRFCLGK